MKSKRVGFWVLLLLIAVNIGMSGYYFDRLPARVASRFDFQGEPTAWMTRETFMIFNSVLLFAMPVFLLLVSWLSMKLPAGMVNMPHREYWLAPERKAQTAARLFGSMLWFAVGMELFLTAIVGLVYWANVGHPEVMRRTPIYLLGGFLAFVIVWIVCFYRKFQVIPHE